MKKLILVGAGGLGLELAAYARDVIAVAPPRRSPWEIAGFLDDTKAPDTLHAGLPVLGSIDAPIDSEALYLIAVGAPEGRAALAAKMTEKGARFARLIHPAAYFAPTAHVSAGCLLAPFAFAGPESVLDDHAMLNIYASAAHESRIGACAVLSPYAGTQARAKVEAGAFLGAHAIATYGVTVGARAKVAAGSVVYQDIPEGCFALGNPARVKNPEM